MPRDGVQRLGPVPLTVLRTATLSPSTSRSIPAGSLVLTSPIEAEEVRVGDVVAFRPPPGFGSDTTRPVLHRVAALERLNGADGPMTMTTRGDANAVSDPWRVALDGAGLSRERLHVPVLGWLAAAGRTQLLLLGGGLGCCLLAVRRLRARASVHCRCPEHPPAN